MNNKDQFERIMESLNCLIVEIKNLRIEISGNNAKLSDNEYLQAYHPEQSGIKEMKVVGLHPLQHKGEK